MEKNNKELENLREIYIKDPGHVRGLAVRDYIMQNYLMNVNGYCCEKFLVLITAKY